MRKLKEHVVKNSMTCDETCNECWEDDVNTTIVFTPKQMIDLNGALRIAEASLEGLAVRQMMAGEMYDAINTSRGWKWTRELMKHVSKVKG